MSKKNNLSDFIVDIAQTFREENESNKLINPQNFSSEIKNFGSSMASLNKKFNEAFAPYKEEEPLVTYGVSFDRNVLTAGTWETYTDDASGLEPAYMDFQNDKFVDNGWLQRYPFNKIKPCLLKDGEVVGYLNPNDYSKFEDGSEAPITDMSAGNVMVEIPYMSYKLSTDGTTISVKLSSQLPDDSFNDSAFWYKGEKKDKIYVSAYLSEIDAFQSKGFRSISGTRLNYFYQIGYEESYSHLEKTGSNYEFIPYNVLVMLQCMYAVMFKTTNSQTQLGFGYGTTQTIHDTGKLDNRGMYYGKADNTSGVKCFGIEDIYGARMTICPGFYVDENYYPRFIDVKNPESSYSPEKIGDYITTPETIEMRGGTLSRITTDIYGISEIGFFYKTKSTTKTIGFCDSNFYKYNSVCCRAGLVAENDGDGIFSCATQTPNTTIEYYGTRLVYYP